MMGYPQVEMVIAMIRGGNNFDVLKHVCRVAHSIRGKCPALIKGKTHKRFIVTANFLLTRDIFG